MASSKEKELKRELDLALSEVGQIQPWFDKRFKAWIFSHPLYPSVASEGDSAQEVIEKYPKYLEVFIEHRLQNRIHPLDEKKTKGKGGHRPSAGRPKGSVSEQTKQIRVPVEIAEWLKQPGIIRNLRELMRLFKHC